MVIRWVEFTCTPPQLEANYPHEDEAKARKWIEDVVGVKLEGNFFEALKDGSVLCRLLNCLEPGLVPAKYEKSSQMPFQQVTSAVHDPVTQ